MITNTTKKSTILQSSSISFKIVQGCQKVIKNHNWKKIDKDHSNITPKALISGNSDQNADSDEFQEINDNDLQAYEREFEPVRKDKKKKSNQPL